MLKLMQNGRLIVLLPAVVSGLAACGGGASTGNAGAGNVAQASARACTPPRAHWLPPGPLDAGLSPPINRLALDRNGLIFWNGQRIGRAQLAR